ncbi:MAG: OmpA family protein [Gammaproteobacteria bacterium]|nr:OmpA family protein [Gammaproteobacteria bacterium]MBT8443674.1 OmpA family protein [Gammaproteobacteria bacterium]NND35572.1 OmpA family protein [Gammaproteobacteria bacterium]
MKHSLMALTLATLITTSVAQAETPPAETPKSVAKQSVVIVGTAVTGAVLGGPVGYMLGGLTGAWLAGNIARADERDDSIARLAVAREEIDTMSAELSDFNVETQSLADALQETRTAMSRYRHLASDYVSFELLFHTGDASLTDAGEARLNQLAMFLAEQPDIDITLSGFADPRGDDEFNLALSEERVRTVAGTLEAGGVDSGRITVNAFGDQRSTSADGDLDAYALDRRVSIDLSVPDFAAEVASNID